MHPILVLSLLILIVEAMSGSVLAGWLLIALIGGLALYWRWELCDTQRQLHQLRRRRQRLTAIARYAASLELPESTPDAEAVKVLRSDASLRQLTHILEHQSQQDHRTVSR